MKVGGVWLDFVKPDEVMLHIWRCVERGSQSVIANHNAHSIYLCRVRRSLRKFFEEADLIQVDSQPLILWSKALGRPTRRFHRSTYLDWREQFWSLADKEGWKVFFVGGEPGVAETAARNLGHRWPRTVVATHHGYFDHSSVSPDNAEVLRRIEEFKPQVLLVGMGMPIQEEWVQTNRTKLPSIPILTVGAAFDYEAGRQVAAPRWMGRWGLEWAFRLMVDPRRLVTRYCVEPWFLVGSLVAEIFSPLQRQGPKLSDGELSKLVARRGDWAPRH